MRWAVLLLSSLLLVSAETAASRLALTLRTRHEPFKGSGAWVETTFKVDLEPKKTALVICDMWDDHWCKSAAKRCGELARQADPVVAALRSKGVTIVHCPSDTMAYYADATQRKAMLAITKATPPDNKALTDPPLPIDDKDGGCDDEMPVKSFRAWKRQHEAIRISEGDFISDQGTEVYSLLKARGIDTLLIMGVHTNMCVCNRSFAIKQMTRWGIKCILIRDLTDAMYNPKRRPFVSHEEGTNLVIQHIEQHWCPTVLTRELMR
ncbi:MAG: isochorismatase family protein [Planctomycetia bacterium]|nr:isochorismatase family protein [Planctomycetia bacterium]